MAPLRPEPDRRPDALRGSREPRQWGRISLVLAGVAFVIWLGWSVIKTDYYRNAIPQEIGLVLGLATTGSESSMLSWLLPIRPQSCGGAIFELDDATARAIRERGIGFFNGVTQGRGVPDPAYQMYKPWQETPLPDGWISPSMARPVVHGLGLDYAVGIAESASRPGSFYTTGSSQLLVVIPERHLVVYTY